MELFKLEKDKKKEQWLSSSNIKREKREKEGKEVVAIFVWF